MSSSDESGAATTKLYCGEQYDSTLGMYNLRARYYRSSTGTFNQRDDFEGNNDDPITLHKYLYANCDPANVIDPSGNQGDLMSLISAIAIDAVAFARTAFAVYLAYTEAETIVEALQIAAVVASGGSVSYVKIAALAVNFVPFGKLLNKIGAQKAIGFVGKNLLKQVYRFTNKSQIVGEVGALMTIYKMGLKRIGFKPRYHGFDDIVEDSAGNLIVLEAKGGEAALATVKSDNQQMSKGWINEKIAKLKVGTNEERAIALRLEKAKADGTLKGMIVRTKAEGAVAFDPQAELKDWKDIGATVW